MLTVICWSEIGGFLINFLASYESGIWIAIHILGSRVVVAEIWPLGQGRLC